MTDKPPLATTRQLHDLGQRLWIDNITRTMLDDGTLAKYIELYAVTGLTSNPSIFEKAIGSSHAYDADIADKARAGLTDAALFTALALEDLQRAADLFRPDFELSGGVDGWVSMEVSPVLAADTKGSIAAAAAIHRQADRDNLFVKIPGTPEGVPAIEEAIFRGVPINVTLLFSAEQYVASAEAYLRGIERRVAAGLNPRVASVASLFVSRWDVAANPRLPADLHNRLGIAVAQQTYVAYRGMLASVRWQKVQAAGARPQRLLWASTGTKDPKAPDTLYVEALIAPDTINTLPDKTLKAFAEHGRVGPAMAVDGGDSAVVIASAKRAGVDSKGLAAQLQKEGADSFTKDWRTLMGTIAERARAFAA